MVLSVLVTFALALPQTTVPIGYEFSAELAYPVPESIPNALILMFSQVLNLIFYIFVSIASLKRYEYSCYNYKLFANYTGIQCTVNVRVQFYPRNCTQNNHKSRFVTVTPSQKYNMADTTYILFNNNWMIKAFHYASFSLKSHASIKENAL